MPAHRPTPRWVPACLLVLLLEKLTCRAGQNSEGLTNTLERSRERDMGRGIASRAEESPGEKINATRNVASQKEWGRTVGGRQMGEGVYRGRGFSGKKKEKVKGKNALDWEKINQTSAGEKISFKTWAETIQTAFKQVRWSFLLVLLMLRLQVAMMISIIRTVIACYFMMGTTQKLQQLLQTTVKLGSWNNG